MVAYRKKVLVAIRIPEELAARLDTRCRIRKQGKTDVLLDAIERGWDDLPAISGSETFGVRINHNPDSIPDCTLQPTINMDALRAICAGNMPTVDYVESGLVEDVRPRCCECDKPMTGRMFKGHVVAWACNDQGCPMWGRERRES